MVVSGMKVRDVDPASPLYGQIQPGYSIVAINGRPVLDSLDYQFRTVDERVRIRFADKKGGEREFEFDNLYPGALGLRFDDDRIKVCNCNCIFCFVRQQPKGMRRTLYVRDEDYRLSFTHGNFITLSNVTDREMARIIEQRLSPLYISVHATDDRLRRRMLRKAKLAPILPRLRHLADNGIRLHTQVVVCPGINDGEQLERTIDDLALLYPGVSTLAVVPVGLTKYRDRLPRLSPHSAEEAVGIIRLVESRQRKLLSRLGSRFVWAADEFYIVAGRRFPNRSSYEEMAQFENGVGMVREFLTVFNRRRASLKRIKSKKRVLLVTGRSAYPFLSRFVVPFLRQTCGLRISLLVVENRFWGDTITVSGLLTGRDVLRGVKSRRAGFDKLVLPPNCLNGDALFLDDMPLSEFEANVGKPVAVGSYNLAQTIREVFQ